ncbi:MAG TPA: L-aspartate oxidase [candidate division WOR-3 bacterium]|uniref:L-aspartate oxidase n=1 Tax=candidate division WOR-3 bacterium TaxID=2052148 RepID=A0A7V0XEK7_UNCW3|nr:L-aspartate oxidase [candidate division WOR-3 bacterium]
MPAPARTVTSDYLVIGSGIAGLWFAHRLSDAGRVMVVTKKTDVESATNYAQGGIAAAFAPDDSPARHCADTLQAGAGLARPEIVDIVTEAGPPLVRELARVGVAFSTFHDTQGREHFELGLEGGHHRRRIVHAADHTGLEIERGLIAAVRSRPQASFSEDVLALDLLLDTEGRCVGSLALDTVTGESVEFRARVTLLAAGGIGQVYPQTTNPPIATGDGIAMAWRAGARIANMEFIQFHPTSLYGHDVGGRAFLISEAVRGEGAVLRTLDGRTFMERYHPDASLAPRDVVARAIQSEMKRHGDAHVLLDATVIAPERIRQRFPTIYRQCFELGIDMTREPLPVVPAAHYVCGGIAVNTCGETSVPGLLAAGECACTGLHGANRLASNSLLEALVFADRAARKARDLELKTGASQSAIRDVTGLRFPAVESPADLVDRIRLLMWQEGGIVRTDRGLARADKELAALDQGPPGPGQTATPEECEAHNLLTVARLIVASARRRPESRGLHYNEDHPNPDIRFARDTVLSRKRRSLCSCIPQ